MTTSRRRVTNEELADNIHSFREEYRRSSLNGEAQTLRELAKVAPQLQTVAAAAPHLTRLAEKADALVQLADKSPDLVALARDRADREGAGRFLRRITGWTPGEAKGCVALIVSGIVVSAFAWWLAHGAHF